MKKRQRKSNKLTFKAHGRRGDAPPCFRDERRVLFTVIRDTEVHLHEEGSSEGPEHRAPHFVSQAYIRRAIRGNETATLRCRARFTL